MTANVSRARSGFALLAVLWVLVGLSALALGAALVAREALAGARNRMSLTRAAWTAEGCAETGRAAIGAALGGGGTESSALVADPKIPWRTLDDAMERSPLWTDAASNCEMSLVPVGAKLDITAADGAQLRALFAALSISADRADSLADALLDWQDPDDLLRPRGVERDWYEAHGRRQPRDSSIEDLRELARVRGFEPLIPMLDSVAWVEPGRLLVDHAPITALASLPGFSPEVLSRVADRRGQSASQLRGPLNFPSLAAQLPPAAARELAVHFGALGHLVTNEPEAWLLTVRASAGVPPVTAEIDLRLARAERRAAVVRRRTRP